MVILIWKFLKSFSLALFPTDFGLSYAKKGELLPYIIKVINYIIFPVARLVIEYLPGR